MKSFDVANRIVDVLEDDGMIFVGGDLDENSPGKIDLFGDGAASFIVEHDGTLFRILIEERQLDP